MITGQCASLLAFYYVQTHIRDTQTHSLYIYNIYPNIHCIFDKYKTTTIKVNTHSLQENIQNQMYGHFHYIDDEKDIAEIFK